MLEIPMHAGTEHPNFTLIVLSSLLAFITGLGLGTYGDRARRAIRSFTNRLME